MRAMRFRVFSSSLSVSGEAITSTFRNTRFEKTACEWKLRRRRWVGRVNRLWSRLPGFARPGHIHRQQHAGAQQHRRQIVRRPRQMQTIARRDGNRKDLREEHWSRHAINSLRAITGMAGPVLFTQIFAVAISPRYGLHLAGAPYDLAAVLLGASMLLAVYVTRPSEARQAAPQPVDPANPSATA